MGSSFLSDPEEQRRVQEANELTLLRMSVIQIQIRSQVPGVIRNGLYTIPVQVPVSRKWTEVFKMEKVQVRMDPSIHQLLGRNKEIDIHSEVFDYFHQYNRNRSIYVVDIQLRPPPKTAAVKNTRGRKPKASTKASRASKANSKQTKAPVANKKQTRSQRLETSPLPKTEPRSGPKRLHSNGPGRPRNVPQPQDDAITAVAALQEETPFPSVSNSVFRMPSTVSLPQKQREAFVLPERFVFRDESTMAGDIRHNGEADVKTGILKYIQDHCSNRDMLEIQQELSALKQQKKFQSLNRLIRFTSGFLQNAFVDDHN